MTWDFIEWSDPWTMNLQLNFDKHELVSMKMPLDKIRIKFWNQEFFQAHDGSFVEFEKTIEKNIFTQSRNEELVVLSESLGMLIVTAAATTVITAYCCTNMPLTPLWELLNTLQIMVHIPIFSLQIPGIVFIVYEIII